MAKFTVLAAIEHGDKLYVPKGTATAAHWSATVDEDGKLTGNYTSPSVSHGRPVPVDGSGTIELTALEAAPLRAAGALGEEDVKETGNREPLTGKKKS